MATAIQVTPFSGTPTTTIFTTNNIIEVIPDPNGSKITYTNPNPTGGSAVTIVVTESVSTILTALTA